MHDLRVHRSVSAKSRREFPARWRRHCGAPRCVSNFGLKFALRLNSLHGKATRGSLAIELGYWPWEQNIRSVTSKAALVNRHFGMTNTPKTFSRCLRRMPGFEGFWFSYRTSSAETSFTQGNAVSWQNRSDLRVPRGPRNDQSCGRVAP